MAFSVSIHMRSVEYLFMPIALSISDWPFMAYIVNELVNIEIKIIIIIRDIIIHMTVKTRITAVLTRKLGDKLKLNNKINIF